MNQLTQYLPKKAHKRLQGNQGAVLIDVRTEAENKSICTLIYKQYEKKEKM